MIMVKWTVCGMLGVGKELLLVKLTRYQGTMLHGPECSYHVIVELHDLTQIQST